jgi:hypothetical protein
MTPCVKCKGMRAVQGTLVDIGTGGRPSYGGYFRPSNLKESLKNFFVVDKGAELSLVVCACQECGFVWTDTNAIALKEYVTNNCNGRSPDTDSQSESSTPKFAVDQCPSCSVNNLVAGAFVVSAQRGGGVCNALFRPDSLKRWSFTAYGAGVAVNPSGKACMNCGFVWSHIDCSALADFLTKHCREE